MSSSMKVNPKKQTQVSIIIPTYNESQNIIQILRSIGENLPKNTSTEAIVIDDNSPDGTGTMVEDYLNNVKRIAGYTIDIIHRTAKKGLSSAVLKGILYAKGETIVVMDSDFSHPPQIIPKMVEMLRKSHCDIVVASRYVQGGAIQGWSVKRKIMSKLATSIAKLGLRIGTSDPMSGFFAFKKNLIKGLKIDAIGYKMLLEILVKTRGANVKEVPYTFTNRKLGSRKVTLSVVLDYTKSVWKLYFHGKSVEKQEKRTSVHFLSKTSRFFTVGVSGLGVNYLLSFLFANEIMDLWYLHANVIGIFASMTSNFIFNKIWTFKNREFVPKKMLVQYGKFVGFSSLGALIQLSIVFYLIEEYQIAYQFALIFAVLTAAFGNFILNKKWTFNEKLWS